MYIAIFFNTEKKQNTPHHTPPHSTPHSTPHSFESFMVNHMRQLYSNLPNLYTRHSDITPEYLNKTSIFLFSTEETNREPNNVMMCHVK